MLRNFFRYLWDGLGGQMAEFSLTLTGKIPAQITMAGLLFAALAALVIILTLLFGGEVYAPTRDPTPTP